MAQLAEEHLPQAMRYRVAMQIVPTSGLRSVSLWDAPDPEALREWCAVHRPCACLLRSALAY